MPETVEWETFIAQVDMRQGEHVSLIGPTGAGKTTLGLALLPLRDYVCCLATKPRDATMSGLIRTGGYRRIRSWPPPPIGIKKSMRVVLWPEYRRPEDVRTQQIEIARAIREMFVEESWTIFADELFYLCRFLKLGPLLEGIWTQGRSLNVTLIGGTQRPAHVPLLAYDQATHLFFWRDNDRTNLQRIGGLGGMDADVIRKTVARLPHHHALYLNTRSGEMVVTKAPRR